jgi:hypothetical protein
MGIGTNRRRMLRQNRRMTTSTARPTRPHLALAAAAALVGCASLPKERVVGIEHTVPLETALDEPHVRIDLYVDRERMGPGARITRPVAEIAPGARPETVPEPSARLVANNAARSLCNELAPWVEWVEPGSDDALTARLVVTAIVPTNLAAAGASAVADVFIPGPARLPTGLGSLAMDGELVNAEGRTVAAVRWARGANAVTDNAQVSAIGDAWQLADEFGEELAKALLVDRKIAGARTPDRLPAEKVKANRALCSGWFGYLNPAAVGAGRLVPLTPELIDPGPPQEAAPDTGPRVP